ncbi:MAG: capsule assembly Wzi family protein [Treponema sp.]|nr:capsule assembly Wzi family protein [Treponema sp.]
MNKFARTAFLLAALFFAATTVSAQEALKSTEEEYYDFLALQGITQRPTLNYRTLSDSVWSIGTETKTFTDEDGNEQTVEEPLAHPWQYNNLGKMRTLWQPQTASENGYLRGVPQGVFLKIYGPEWYNSFNTAAPYGQNDGALWQGKGYNTSLTAGARLEGYGLELTLKPQVSFSQNRDFKMLHGVYGSNDENDYSYFWRGNIDLVQRYGNSSFWTFDWGDTEVRYSWRTLTVGFGFQSPWLGPAWLNPMLGSNNAPTYPKLDIGLRRQRIVIPKVNWYLGDIEGRIWTGFLSESNYFDEDSSNDSRMLNAISLAFSPSFIPGFTIGVNRIFLTKWRMENLKYIGRLFTTVKSNALASSGNDEDQKISLFASWHFSQIGFEVYGELGIDDFTSDKTSNLFHTAIYTVGAKQKIPLDIFKVKGLQSELIFEWNNFEMSQDFQLQWHYMGYYAHGFVKQGYTQKGQIIGAGSGFFGNSQFLGYKVYYPKGSTLLYFQRNVPDMNYIYNKADGNMVGGKQSDWYAMSRADIILGIQSVFFATKDLRLSLGFDVMKMHKYLYKDDSSFYNFHISAGLKYNI